MITRGRGSRGVTILRRAPARGRGALARVVGALARLAGALARVAGAPAPVVGLAGYRDVRIPRRADSRPLTCGDAGFPGRASAGRLGRPAAGEESAHFLISTFSRPPPG